MIVVKIHLRAHTGNLEIEFIQPSLETYLYCSPAELVNYLQQFLGVEKLLLLNLLRTDS